MPVAVIADVVHQGGVRGGAAELLHPFQLLGGAGQGPVVGGADGGAVIRHAHMHPQGCPGMTFPCFVHEIASDPHSKLFCTNPLDQGGRAFALDEIDFRQDGNDESTHARAFRRRSRINNQQLLKNDRGDVGFKNATVCTSAQSRMRGFVMCILSFE